MVGDGEAERQSAPRFVEGEVAGHRQAGVREQVRRIGFGGRQLAANVVIGLEDQRAAVGQLDPERRVAAAAELDQRHRRRDAEVCEEGSELIEGDGANGTDSIAQQWRLVGWPLVISPHRLDVPLFCLHAERTHDDPHQRDRPHAEGHEEIQIAQLPIPCSATGAESELR